MTDTLQEKSKGKLYKPNTLLCKPQHYYPSCNDAESVKIKSLSTCLHLRHDRGHALHSGRDPRDENKCHDQRLIHDGDGERNYGLAELILQSKA